MALRLLPAGIVASGGVAHLALHALPRHIALTVAACGVLVAVGMIYRAST